MAFIGEIRMWPGPRVPDGWMACDGALLPISEYEALYSLIGTIYGGDGVTTFQLPNLMGRVGIHMGQGQGLSPRVLGEFGGASSVTLVASNLPAHSHTVQANTGTPATPSSGVLCGGLTYGAYDAATMVSLDPRSIEVEPPSPAVPHENMSPYLQFQFIIALSGIYPSPS